MTRGRPVCGLVAVYPDEECSMFIALKGTLMNAGEAIDATTGFTLSRVLSGTPAEVFVHFTEPALFSRWFIVEGFTTPASRVKLDPRPGGMINAVMVPDGEGPEIPFTATYRIVEPQRRIQFKFTDPTEIVTISLLDLGVEGTQLTYSNVGAALTERAAALIGVERMLDALDSSLADLRR
jgi:uncharacterized protein YndB with AHSA1/START domain